jgi:hypothetical protein
MKKKCHTGRVLMMVFPQARNVHMATLEVVQHQATMTSQKAQGLWNFIWNVANRRTHDYAEYWRIGWVPSQERELHLTFYSSAEITFAKLWNLSFVEF